MSLIDNLIGSRLSLISQQDVRYDGVLFSINAKESSIVLRDVQCFGSEDRVIDEDKKVPPNPTILTFVTFPGNEIKDLSVFESADEDAPAPEVPATVTKAEKSAQNRSSDENKQSNRQRNEQGETGRASGRHGDQGRQQGRRDQQPSRDQPRQQLNRDSKPREQQSREHREQQHREQQPREQQHREHQPREQQHREQQHREQPPRRTQQPNSISDSTPASSAGTGEHLAKLRLRKGFDQAAVSEDTAALKSEFDFEAGLTSFNKEEVLATVAESKASIETKKYVKDDFFDMLSNDISEGQNARLRTAQERTLNQDTFGAIAVQQNYRRGGRGGYSGGRGGGSGEGRGGGSAGRYNNNGRGGRGRYNNSRQDGQASS